ncbi:hypothetical protein JCM8202v2_003543 [Rhodotorula sphaerocarpa]
MPGARRSSEESSPATAASNVPHLPPGGHRARVVPTGNVDPSAFDRAEGTEAGTTKPAAHGDPAMREEVVMIQPEGESAPAGDSEHHTSMHLRHGTKEEEAEEERLK